MSESREDEERGGGRGAAMVRQIVDENGITKSTAISAFIRLDLSSAVCSKNHLRKSNKHPSVWLHTAILYVQYCLHSNSFEMNKNGFAKDLTAFGNIRNRSKLVHLPVVVRVVIDPPLRPDGVAACLMPYLSGIGAGALHGKAARRQRSAR